VTSQARPSREDPANCVLAAVDHGRVTIVRSLSPEETRLALDDMRRLYRAHDEMQIMLLVMLNERSFDAAFDGYVEEVRGQGGMDLGRTGYVALDLNRHLLNALASFNMFLDHANIEIVCRFGRDSEQHQRFTQRRNEMHEGIFAYRFCYHFRNYAVHVGLPIQIVTVEAALSPDGAAIIPTLSLAVDPEHLLERFEWKKGIRDDIPGLGVLDVKGLLDEGVRCVTELMGLKNDIMDENVLDPLLRLEALERECARFPGVPYLLEADFAVVPGRTHRVREFPIGLMRSLRSGLEAG
jgi:hypothetical protein